MGMSKVSPPLLLLLDRLDERLEVPLPETLRAFALDDLVEQRRSVLHRLAEDLKQIAFVVAIDENAQPPQRLQVLVDLADAVEQRVVVRVRRVQELDSARLELRHGVDDVVRRDRDVLDAGAAIELEVFVDLRLFLPRSRL